MMTPSLAGLWVLEAAEHRRGEERIYPFGQRPIGALLLTVDGVFSCQVAARQATPSAPLHERLFAIWGRWSATAQVLTLAVEGSCDPTLVGTPQRRSFSIAEPVLTLANIPAPTPDSVAVKYTIRWTRSVVGA